MITCSWHQSCFVLCPVCDSSLSRYSMIVPSPWLWQELMYPWFMSVSVAMCLCLLVALFRLVTGKHFNITEYWLCVSSYQVYLRQLYSPLTLWLVLHPMSTKWACTEHIRWSLMRHRVFEKTSRIWNVCQTTKWEILDGFLVKSAFLLGH